MSALGCAQGCPIPATLSVRITEIFQTAAKLSSLHMLQNGCTHRVEVAGEDASQLLPLVFGGFQLGEGVGELLPRGVVWNQLQQLPRVTSRQ